MRFADRKNYFTNPTAVQLCDYAEEKQSNLIVSVDVTSVDECWNLISQTAPHVCMVKTHIDILTDFSFDFIEALRELAQREKFLLFEDRKFADIGNTVQLQYGKGIYRIAEWANLVTGHAVPGPGMITGMKEIGLPRGHAMVYLAEMSSKDNLAKGDYQQQAIAYAQAHRDFVIGFICTHRLVDSPKFLHLTPGVSMESTGDSLGQSYLTPEVVIQERGSDFIIVGRGICKADDPAQAASRYQKVGWDSYLSLFR